ncbi:MAG TPA: aminotransferase class I/II-fold pyridoxal phosphate-dependent enzyme, partial [Moraxellaceae bacterium]|nr:aminotransferase class I/II-fold pyridoxal phosphate-dependent enzyme [Moraxellaceae bacterium]
MSTLAIDLLFQVEQFLADYPDVSASQFGVLFRKDPNFVGELKKGRNPRMNTVEQLLQAMADYRRQHPAGTVTTSTPTAAGERQEHPMEIKKSDKLLNVCYDIRGPVLKAAMAMEEQGHRIIKLNIGNPAPFGFEAPQEILADVIANLPNAIGYCESKGLFAARKAIVQYYQQRGLFGVDVGDVYIGNGVSELIVMAMQALLNPGDEMLIPAPDYPLWTAAVTLSSGTPVHYLCDEENHWYPDLEDMEK